MFLNLQYNCGNPPAGCAAQMAPCCECFPFPFGTAVAPLTQPPKPGLPGCPAACAAVLERETNPCYYQAACVDTCPRHEAPKSPEEERNDEDESLRVVDFETALSWLSPPRSSHLPLRRPAPVPSVPTP